MFVHGDDDKCILMSMLLIFIIYNVEVETVI